jgi:hypothetical protein
MNPHIGAAITLPNRRTTQQDIVNGIGIAVAIASVTVALMRGEVRPSRNRGRG